MGSKQHDHNEGEKDGSKGNFMDDWITEVNPLVSKEYKEGYRNAAEQRRQSDNDSGGGGGGGGDSSCLVSTVCARALGLPDDCVELRTLRRFRDYYVARLPNGDGELRHYYSAAPRLVQAISSRPDAAEVYHHIYRTVVLPAVALIRRERYAEAFALYRDAMQRLERESKV